MCKPYFLPVLALALTLSSMGCSFDEASPYDAIAKWQAHRVVIRNLKDPDSAQFRNEFVFSDSTVCGAINAKNSFGAYIGFAPYYVIGQVSEIRSEENGEGFDRRFSVVCKKY